MIQNYMGKTSTLESHLMLRDLVNNNSDVVHVAQ